MYGPAGTRGRLQQRGFREKRGGHDPQSRGAGLEPPRTAVSASGRNRLAPRWGQRERAQLVRRKGTKATKSIGVGNVSGIKAKTGPVSATCHTPDMVPAIGLDVSGPAPRSYRQSNGPFDGKPASSVRSSSRKPFTTWDSASNTIVARLSGCQAGQCSSGVAGSPVRAKAIQALLIRSATRCGSGPVPTMEADFATLSNTSARSSE